MRRPVSVFAVLTTVLVSSWIARVHAEAFADPAANPEALIPDFQPSPEQDKDGEVNTGTQGRERRAAIPRGWDFDLNIGYGQGRGRDRDRDDHDDDRGPWRKPSSVQDYCQGHSVKLRSYNFSKRESTTTFCYEINIIGSQSHEAFHLEDLNLPGKVTRSGCRKVDQTSKYIRAQQDMPPGTSIICHTLEGKFNLGRIKYRLKPKNKDDLCPPMEVAGPASGSICRNCQLGDVVQPCTDSCTVSCPTASPRTLATVYGSQTCTRSIISPGPTCTPQTVRSCSTTCPVDCMPNTYTRPAFNCAAACTSMPDALATSSVITLTTPWPVAYRSAANGGSACPMATTTCRCSTSSCKLAPTPYSINPCNANCATVAGAGTARGTETSYYSAATCARFGGASCTNTVKANACSRTCTCNLATATTSCEASAVCTSTAETTASIAGQTDNLPVTKVGYRTCVQSAGPGCASTSTQACSTTKAPINCVQATAATCDTPNCPAIAATQPPSLQTVSCSYPTLTPAQFGGAKCTNNPFPTPTQCPGCTYSSAGCACTSFDQANLATVVSTDMYATTYSSIISTGQSVCSATLGSDSGVDAVNCPASTITTDTVACSASTVITVLPTQDSRGVPDPTPTPTPTPTPSPSSGCPSPFGEQGKNFNAILYGSYAPPSADTEGRLAVGGELHLGTSYSVGYTLGQPPHRCDGASAYPIPALVAGGSFAGFESGQVDNGNFAVLDSATTNISMVVRWGLQYYGCDVVTMSQDQMAANVLDFAAHRDAMFTLSQKLAALNPTLKLVPVYERTALVSPYDGDASAPRPTLEVLTITADQYTVLPEFTNLAELNMANRTDTTLIINLISTGAAPPSVIGMDWEPLRPAGGRVIWNVVAPEGTTATISQVTLHGSVLAPGLTITGSGEMRGHIIADSVDGSQIMQFSQADFVGCIPGL